MMMASFMSQLSAFLLLKQAKQQGETDIMPLLLVLQRRVELHVTSLNLDAVLQCYIQITAGNQFNRNLIVLPL